MKNIEFTKDPVNPNILVVRVDMTKEYGRSSSGKTTIISSSEGNVTVPGFEEAKIWLNVYKK